MRYSIAKKTIYCSLLLGTTFLVSPALAQNVVDLKKNATATNHSAVNATLTVPGSATVTGPDTVAATVGASGAGASAVATVDQSVSNVGNPGLDLHTLPDNTVTVHGSITATNTAHIDSHLIVHGTGGGNSVGASIANGIDNTISSVAVGAAATAGITSRVDNVITSTANKGSDNTVKVDKNVIATNHGAVAANPGGPDEINGSATIVDGISNSIIATAIGASAAANITQTVSNTQPVGMNLKQLPSNAVTVNKIESKNTANVNAFQFIVGNNLIQGGVSNVIGGQAMGASGGANITSQFLNVTTSASTNGATNTVKAKSITAHNTGAVTSTVQLGPLSGANSTTITGGVDNSILSSALGSSALASVTQTASFSTSGGGVTQLAALPSNTTTITGNINSTNGHGAPVTANLTLTGNNNSITSITGGVGNSITAQAIGSLAGASISQHISNVHN